MTFKSYKPRCFNYVVDIGNNSKTSKVWNIKVYKEVQMYWNDKERNHMLNVSQTTIIKL